MAAKIETMENDKKQYIVITFGNEQYGIDISYVDNIVRMQKITRVPRVQNFFKGIINLRGEIVPVMSLRIRMELEEDVFRMPSIPNRTSLRKEVRTHVLIMIIAVVMKTITRKILIWVFIR